MDKELIKLKKVIAYFLITFIVSVPLSVVI